MTRKNKINLEMVPDLGWETELPTDARHKSFGHGFDSCWQFGSQMPLDREEQMLRKEAKFLEEELESIKKRLVKLNLRPKIKT
ncbi:MAG: DUF5320 domain-containing protein [Patescibacteria group bacterium]|nr:DUF5320 domain-containing protein [Patescibacteria group bacterium]MDD5120976.1 DUF5320 domain-containing protein [Patescibacteria group bacterium]MDD5396419.1 DUF5320 domain-containing protein [Patescibacteria group bacterium]